MIDNFINLRKKSFFYFFMSINICCCCLRDIYEIDKYIWVFYEMLVFFCVVK